MRAPISLISPAGVELVQQPDRAADADPVGLDGPVALPVDDGVDAAAADRRSPTRTARPRTASTCSRSSSAPRRCATGTGPGPGAAAGRCPAARAGAVNRSGTARRAARPRPRAAVSNSHPSNRSGNGTTSPVRSSSPVTMALVSRSPRGIDPVLELTAAPAQHGRLHDALAAVGRPVEHRSALPRAEQFGLVDLAHVADSPAISPAVSIVSRAGQHHGPFGKGKKPR